MENTPTNPEETDCPQSNSSPDARTGSTTVSSVGSTGEKSKRRKPKAFRLEFPQKDAESWRREILGTPLGAQWNPDLTHVLKSFVAKEFSDFIKRTFAP